MSKKRSTDAAQPAPAEEYVARVLLVDDQAIVGEAVRRALANQPNLEFHFCGDPQQALDTAQRIAPTVILQDLVMPDVDGLSLVRQYRAHPATRDIPVIVLSTKEDAVVKSEAFKDGANDYLVKLPDPVELLARIRYHSKAHLNQIQRDAAYRALHESQEQLLQLNHELQRLNNLDGLTGLSNRRCFDQHIDKEWRRAERDHMALAAIMVDVDEFKRYNDTYGHLSGDEVLKKVAQAIEASCHRPADLAARFGGEEFAIALASTGPTGAQHVAEQIRANVEQLRIPHSAATATPHVTVSIGVAVTIPRLDSCVAALIEAADIALYEAKRSGRNRVVVYPEPDLPKVGAKKPKSRS